MSKGLSQIVEFAVHRDAMIQQFLSIDSEDVFHRVMEIDFLGRRAVPVIAEGLSRDVRDTFQLTLCRGQITLHFFARSAILTRKEDQIHYRCKWVVDLVSDRRSHAAGCR